jgi:SEC-C motif-containing protein
MNTLTCPCSSGKPYEACCAPYHRHLSSAPTADALMRSRYSGYALGLIDYILETARIDRDEPGARAATAHFCKTTQFTQLEVLASKEEGSTAVVVFIAHLSQGGEDVTFTERSSFKKEQGRWYYNSGEVFKGPRHDITISI